MFPTRLRHSIIPCLFIILSACGGSPTTTPSQTVASSTAIDSGSATVSVNLPTTLSPTLSSSSTPLSGIFTFIDWQNMPVIPAVSDEVKEIYKQGLAKGNNPQAFSKIGDCGSTPAWFLGDFDKGKQFYNLGDYHDLQPVIDYYAGSFGRTSLAAKAGYNASSVFTVLWADPKQCQPNETPLACEYRIHKPILAFIMLGTNDVYHPKDFEPQMRKIIDFSLDNGVIPILVTKADNMEQDHSINATIARLALDYKLPLWNFWHAVYDLPDHGLQEDNAHLTWGPNQFDNPAFMLKAWPQRNLGALQMLQAVSDAVGMAPTPVAPTLTATAPLTPTMTTTPETTP